MPLNDKPAALVAARCPTPDQVVGRRTLEKEAMITNHASTCTTQLYVRRSDAVSLDEIERILS